MHIFALRREQQHRMSDILNEITPLSPKDCFYIADRHKRECTYPLHSHREYELNFIQNGRGLRRIVGDSIEETGDTDLVLIAGAKLEHVWEQGDCKSDDIREITIQFSQDLFPESLTSKNQFAGIKKMFDDASNGIAFPKEAAMKIYSSLDTLADENGSFEQFLHFLNILHTLSKFEYRTLSSTSFAHSGQDSESRRVHKVKKYIDDHFSEEIRLGQLADLVNMSPSAFSRYFKLRTGRTLTSYIIDIRLGVAARMLIDTGQNVSEICYACGFNNLSNFNRMFRAKRGLSPRDFRRVYEKKKVII